MSSEFAIEIVGEVPVIAWYHPEEFRLFCNAANGFTVLSEGKVVFDWDGPWNGNVTIPTKDLQIIPK